MDCIDIKTYVLALKMALEADRAYTTSTYPLPTVSPMLGYPRSVPVLNQLPRVPRVCQADLSCEFHGSTRAILRSTPVSKMWAGREQLFLALATECLSNFLK